MDRILSFSAIFLCLIMASCKNASSSGPMTATEAAHVEIMAIHDEVMPKMSDINRTIKELKKSKTTITQNNTALLDMFSKYISDLEKADDGMMDWMKAYKKPKFDDQSEQTMMYLKGQKKEIEDVKQAMLMSLVNGRGLLNKIKETQAKTAQ